MYCIGMYFESKISSKIRKEKKLIKKYLEKNPLLTWKDFRGHTQADVFHSWKYIFMTKMLGREKNKNKKKSTLSSLKSWQNFLTHADYFCI